MAKNKRQRVVMIIQARMAATRLPGKPMKMILGKPLLGYLFERVRRTRGVDEIILATTVNPRDEEIVKFCEGQQMPCIRGSEENVLERYFYAAQAYDADAIIRITADCPLIDPLVIEKVLHFYLENFPKYDYVANTLQRTYPRGMDVEVFSRKGLEDAYANALLDEEREHVTPYLFRHPEKFAVGSVVKEQDDSRHRWTVDTSEDLELITKILDNIYPRTINFTLEDLLKLLEEHPDWSKINAHVHQKKLGQHKVQ